MRKLRFPLHKCLTMANIAVESFKRDNSNSTCCALYPKCMGEKADRTKNNTVMKLSLFVDCTILSRDCVERNVCHHFVT